MKKFILSIFALSTLSIGANSQTIFQEDFSGGLSSTWTIIDGDGLNSTTAQKKWKNWALFNNDANTYHYAASSSWYNQNNTLGPTNNWLITPQINLPANKRYILTFDALSLEYNDGIKENYEIYYSTTGKTVADFPVSNRILQVNEETATNRKIILPTSTSNQSIYLAFRHISNKKSLLLIDNIVIKEIKAKDIEVISHTINDSYMNGSSATIAGEVRNNGYDTITSYELSYNTGSGAVTETVNVTIPPLTTKQFTHGTQLSLNAADGPYTVNICASITDDAVTDNNCKKKIISVAGSTIDKYVVLEERTGTWCKWCPSGTVALDKIVSEQDKAIGIAVHNGDPMVVTSYDNGAKNFPSAGSFPYAASDRVTGRHAGYMQDLFNSRKNAIAVASVGIESSIANNIITVKAKIKPVANLKGDYRVAVVIVEDNVTGVGNNWLQANGFAGGNNNLLHTVNGQTFNWKDLPNKVNVSEVFGGYDHVARALADNQINGAANSLPATMSIGQEYEKTYTINVNNSWQINNAYAIAMLVDNSTGKILNAFKEKKALGINNNNNEIHSINTSVYPNPTNGITNLTISLEEASEVSLDIVDMNGKIILTNGTKNLNSGKFNYSLNLSDVPNGIYFAKLQVNNTLKTIKISVNK